MPSEVLLTANQTRIFSFDPDSGRLCHKSIQFVDSSLLALSVTGKDKTRTITDDSFVEIRARNKEFIQEIRTSLRDYKIVIHASELFLLLFGTEKSYKKASHESAPAFLYVFSLQMQTWSLVSLPKHCHFCWAHFYPFEDSHAMLLTENGLIYELDLIILEKEKSLDYKWSVFTWCSLQGSVPAYNRIVDAAFTCDADSKEERDKEKKDFKFDSMLLLLETGVVVGLCPIPGARSYPLFLQKVFYHTMEQQVADQPGQLIVRHIVREGRLDVLKKRLVLDQNCMFPLNGLNIATQGPFKIYPEPSLTTARSQKLLYGSMFESFLLVAIMHEDSEWLEMFVALDKLRPCLTLPTHLYRQAQAIGSDSTNSNCSDLSNHVLYLIATLHFDAPVDDVAIDADRFWVVDRQNRCYEGVVTLKNLNGDGDKNNPAFECECHAIKTLSTTPARIIVIQDDQGEACKVHFGTQFVHNPGFDNDLSIFVPSFTDAQFDAMHRALIADRVLLDDGIKFKAFVAPLSRPISLPSLPKEIANQGSDSNNNQPTGIVFSDSSLPMDENVLIQASQYLCTHVLPTTRSLSRQYKSIIERRAELLTRAALKCQSMIQRMNRPIIEKHVSREQEDNYLGKIRHLVSEVHGMEEWCDKAEGKLLLSQGNSQDTNSIATRITILNRALKVINAEHVHQNY